ncbi:MAG: hypothetical protein ABI912_07350, partial [Actinomycetota bacterium]
VQHRMLTVVNSRVAETQARIADLVELTGQLQAAATRLASTPAVDGGCAPDCACMAADVDYIEPGAAAGRAETLPFPVARTSVADSDQTPIACTLTPDVAGDRMNEWRSLVAQATGSEPTDDGIALMFGHDVVRTAEIAQLAAAEFECCSFFRFTVGISASGVRLEVGAPPDARHLITEVFSPLATTKENM